MVMRLTGFICLLALSLLASLWPLAVIAADIEVHLDRDPARMNEAFSVMFVADGWVDDDPDLSPLREHFKILDTTANTRLHIHNMNATRSKSWTVRLLPKHTGELTIPAIHFGNDVSPPSKVQVAEATAAEANHRRGDVFVELSTESGRVYRNAQVLVTVRLYRTMDTRQASLSEPELENGDAVVEMLDDKTYESWHNGQHYAVLERRYALFPQTSGRLRINPVTFRGEVITRSHRAMDPFARDPHARYDTLHGKMITRQSLPAELKVRPPPAAADGDWLPARSVRLEENWSEQDPEFEVGKPITRTLTLTAGQLNAEQLPALAGNLPDALRIYPEQPQMENDKAENGISGRRTERYALIPTQPGEFTLPAVQVRWFDIIDGEFRQAQLPERVIKVAPGATARQPDAGAEPGARPQPESRTAAPAGGAGRARFVWPVISLLLAIGWLLTVWLWWRQRRRIAQPAVAQSNHAGDCLRRLQAACAINDPARARTTLLEWSQAHLGEVVSLNELAAYYGPPLATEIGDLNEVLYGPTARDWRGQSLAQVVLELHKQQPPQAVDTQAAGLAPLYRL